MQVHTSPQYVATLATMTTLPTNCARLIVVPFSSVALKSARDPGRGAVQFTVGTLWAADRPHMAATNAAPITRRAICSAHATHRARKQQQNFKCIYFMRLWPRRDNHRPSTTTPPWLAHPRNDQPAGQLECLQANREPRASKVCRPVLTHVPRRRTSCICGRLALTRSSQHPVPRALDRTPWSCAWKSVSTASRLRRLRRPVAHTVLRCTMLFACRCCRCRCL